MYFWFFKLKKWGKRRRRLADAIVRCCLRETGVDVLSTPVSV